MKIKIPFSNRYLEIRSTLANPSQWLIDALTGGNKSAAGVSVTESNAMKSTAVFACVRILAESIASLPLPVYRRLQPRGKERAPEHPLYTILHDIANPEMTAFTFKETLMGHLALWGNAYAEIEWGANGWPVALWPLRPDRTWPERDANKNLIYKLILSDGTQAILPAYRVFHVPGMGFDGLVGYSPISMAREAIGLSLATEEYGARFFGNGAKPGGVLEHPGKLKQETQDRLRKSWNEMHQGLSNQHRIAILEEGMQYKQIGIPPEDSQFLETRKFQLTEIARIFRVPPHMLADLERATFSNIEHQSLEFVVHTLRPWLVRWEQSIHLKLLGDEERKVYFAEFLVDGLLRGDIKSRYEAYAVARQNGWMNANDILELENRNPIPGGDIYLINGNMIPVDMAGKHLKNEPSDLPPEPRSIERRTKVFDNRKAIAKSYRTIFADAVGRVLKREEADIMRQAHKMLGQRSTEAFDAWLSDFYRDHEEYVSRQMEPVMRSYAEAVQAAVDAELESNTGFTPEMEEFVRAYLFAYIVRHNGASIVELRKVLQEALEAQADQIEALQKTFDQWQEGRKNEIAHEESIRLGNATALTAYALAGVTKVRWVAIGTSCPYCKELDGKVVGIDKAFLNADEDFQPEGADTPLRPSRVIKHPPAHRGCDCHLLSGA